MNDRAKILVLALFQVGTLLAWAGYHEGLWQSAPTFRIALNPVDPFDVLRGRYFILNPKGTRIDASSPFDLKAFPGLWHQGRVQVAFCPSGAIRTICGFAPLGGERPALAGALWASGEISLSTIKGQTTGNVDLGLDRFFLPNRVVLPAPENAPGWELEVVHREGQRLLPKRLWFGGKPIDFH